MYWIALTLGFFGSLHCIGMCGPLALAVHSGKRVTGFFAVLDTLQYNSGRTLGYIALGIIAGLLGSFANIGDGQRVVSVMIGLSLVFLLLFSINPDQLINKIPSFKRVYTFISTKLYNLLNKSRSVPSFLLGTVNGFLPCGLVYIALAGSLSLGNLWGSMGFMLFFGQRLRVSLKRLYPIITLVMGTYLIYRGLMSKLPLELDFFEALRNPVMCH